MEDSYSLVAHDATLALKVAAATMGDSGLRLAAIAGIIAGRIDKLDATQMEPAASAVLLPPQKPAMVQERPHGRSEGTIPTSVKRARRLRLVGVDGYGHPTGYVDEGTAAELAGRNKIAPSTIYRIARSGAAVNGFRVERILE